MLSNSSKYAVKALAYIVTASSEENKLLVKNIAEETDVPKPFLSKILQQLSTKKYISSTKGPNGGFFVTKEQLKHSVLDIVIEIEGKDRLQLCALNFENCDAENPCPIHKFIAPAKEALRESFEAITLEDLKDKGTIENLDMT